MMSGHMVIHSGYL